MALSTMILQPVGNWKVSSRVPGACGPREPRSAVSNFDASIQHEGKCTTQCKGPSFRSDRFRPFNYTFCGHRSSKTTGATLDKS